MNTPHLENELDNVRVVDFRLACCKEELDSIYDKQDELLRKLYESSPAIYNDFRDSRATRLEEVMQQEKENAWLLQTWLF